MSLLPVETEESSLPNPQSLQSSTEGLWTEQLHHSLVCESYSLEPQDPKTDPNRSSGSLPSLSPLTFALHAAATKLPVLWMTLFSPTRLSSSPQAIGPLKQVRAEVYVSAWFREGEVLVGGGGGGWSCHFFCSFAVPE